MDAEKLRTYGNFVYGVGAALMWGVALLFLLSAFIVLQIVQDQNACIKEAYTSFKANFCNTHPMDVLCIKPFNNTMEDISPINYSQ